MQTIGLEVLKTIIGVILPNGMSEKQLAAYNADVNEFIDALSNKSYELTKIFVVRDFHTLRKRLTDIAVVLRRIYAIEAAEKCYRLIDLVADENKSAIDIALEKFISELNTLSIDFQLAQHKSSMKVEKRPSQEANAVKNILAVDDEPVILNALKGVINGEKYKFSGIASGKAALRYLETHALPDLIILDIDMPEMDGLELAENIAAKGYSVPFIFLTSNSTRENVLEAIKIGAVGFLVKPINEDLILSRIGQFMN